MKTRSSGADDGPRAAGGRAASGAPRRAAGLISLQRGDLPLLVFAHLAAQEGLVHALTTREGGVSQPPHQSLNLARTGDDAPEAVAENRRRLQHALSPGRLIFSRQVHGTDVAAIRAPVEDGDFPVVATADAMVTDRPGLLLTVLVADCQAVMLFDPRRRVVANVHSGWRGSIANVIGATVAVMHRSFGCRPSDILAGIGPSLGPCCAEFRNYRREIPQPIWPYRVSQHHFDFWKLSRDQLTAAGLRTERIVLAQICTQCHPERFYSYRSGDRTGRCAAAIGMPSG
ncbi:MAG: peptidoglycan editing factor PgeF [Desulfobacterales bacterium]|nr:peptidoglycan editing factor PgeF [Desulfobacterales bacterium]